VLRPCHSVAMPNAGTGERPHADSWVVQQGELCVGVCCGQRATLLPFVDCGTCIHMTFFTNAVGMQVVTIVDQLCLANMSEGGGQCNSDTRAAVQLTVLNT
jgi:hypothetical protein